MATLKKPPSQLGVLYHDFLLESCHSCKWTAAMGWRANVFKAGVWSFVIALSGLSHRSEALQVSLPPRPQPVTKPATEPVQKRKRAKKNKKKGRQAKPVSQAKDTSSTSVVQPIAPVVPPPVEPDADSRAQSPARNQTLNTSAAWSDRLSLRSADVLPAGLARVGLRRFAYGMGRTVPWELTTEVGAWSLWGFGLRSGNVGFKAGLQRLGRMSDAQGHRFSLAASLTYLAIVTENVNLQNFIIPMQLHWEYGEPTRWSKYAIYWGATFGASIAAGPGQIRTGEDENVTELRSSISINYLRLSAQARLLYPNSGRNYWLARIEVLPIAFGKLSLRSELESGASFELESLPPRFSPLPFGVALNIKHTWQPSTDGFFASVGLQAGNVSYPAIGAYAPSWDTFGEFGLFAIPILDIGVLF